MSNDPEVARQMRTDGMKALQSSRPRMRICYQDAVRKNPKLSGEITTRLTVAANGDPVVIDGEGSSIKDKEAAQFRDHGLVR